MDFFLLFQFCKQLHGIHITFKNNVIERDILVLIQIFQFSVLFYWRLRNSDLKISMKINLYMEELMLVRLLLEEQIGIDLSKTAIASTIK